MNPAQWLGSTLRRKTSILSHGLSHSDEKMVDSIPPAQSWLDVRRSHLKNSLIAIRNKRKLVVRQPFFILERETSDVEITTVYHSPITTPCDIYFSQGYSPDHDRLISARQSGHVNLISCWFWDNHHLIGDTLKSAMLSDINFYAHYFKSYYIKNPLSVDGAFVPLCPIFWTEDIVDRVAKQSLLSPRSDLLYGGYNSYAEFPERDDVIRNIQEMIPSNRLFLTPHGTPTDQHPYYGLSKEARLLEWMKYKVSLCIAFSDNTAMRMFDALLGGGIPILLGRPADLDMIITPSQQQQLPVIVLDDANPVAIAAAYREGLRQFDEGGHDGVMRRHRYVLGNHMPHHRLDTMITAIRTIAEQAEHIEDQMGA